MYSRRVLMGLALAALAVPAASLRAADEKLDADLKAIQGKWATKAGNGDKVTYTVEGKKLTVVAPSRTYEITMTLDPAAKPEKTLDLKINEAPDDAKGKTAKGIYKFDGNDKLIFCFRPMGERPTKYEMEGFEQILTELKRKKK